MSLCSRAGLGGFSVSGNELPGKSFVQGLCIVYSIHTPIIGLVKPKVRLERILSQPFANGLCSGADGIETRAQIKIVCFAASSSPPSELLIRLDILAAVAR